MRWAPAIMFVFAADMGLPLTAFDCLLLILPLCCSQAVPISISGWGVREASWSRARDDGDRNRTGARPVGVAGLRAPRNGLIGVLPLASVESASWRSGPWVSEPSRSVTERRDAATARLNAGELFGAASALTSRPKRYSAPRGEDVLRELQLAYQTAAACGTDGPP